MGFRTKLDFSDNRQVKQRIETTTILSGGTAFGVPYGDLPTGPNTSLSSITQTINNLTGTFSGNSGTTIFTWTDTRMSLGDSSLSAITPSNSATTQNTGAIFTPDISSLYNIDGNTGYTHYTGVSYSMYANTFTNLGGGAYSGNVTSQQLQILETIGLDFTGRTIWNDVSGITRTNRLIITDNPQAGYVWTCIDSEGMGEWSFNASGATIWTAGTGVNSAVLGGSNGIASGITSVSEGTSTIAGGDYSHAEGYDARATGDASHAEGAQTRASGWTSHAEGQITKAYGDWSHAEGNGTQALGNAAHSEGWMTIASGQASHAEGGVYFDGVTTWLGNAASGQSAHVEGARTNAGGNASHAGGYNSSVYSDFGFIHSNTSFISSGSTNSAILGGSGNTISGHTDSFIGGGNNNLIDATYYDLFNRTESIIGGEYNTIRSSKASGIYAGSGNTIAYAPHSIIAGGYGNRIGFSGITTDPYAYSLGNAIFGGHNNEIINNDSYLSATFLQDNVILGGAANTIDISNTSVRYNAIVAGTNHIIGASVLYSSIMGGQGNILNNAANYSSIVAGTDNKISNTDKAFIGGGAMNLITGNSQNVSIIGGNSNEILGTSQNTTIIGGNGSQILDNSNDATIIGGAGNQIINNSDDSAIIGGTGGFISNIPRSIILGGESLSARTIDTTYTPNISISYQDGSFDSKLGINTVTPEYVIDVKAIDSRLVLADVYTGDDLPFKSFVLSANSTNVPQIAAATSNYLGGYGLSIAMGVVGNNSESTLTSELVGLSGDTYINSTQQTNNLNILNRSGGSGTNHIRMYAGVNSVSAAANSDFHIQGVNTLFTGTNRGYIGIANDNPQYLIDARGGTNNKFYYDGAGAGGAGAVILSARTGLAMMAVNTNTSVFNQSGGVSIGIRAWDDVTYTAYGKPGDSHIYSSKQSNGLNIISSDGTGTEDYIRFWTGGDCASPSAMAMNIVGSGATQGYIGINTLLPTQILDVNGNGRFRNIGSTASAGALHYTADGSLTTNTSDERLKTNITTLTGALAKVNQLRGVKYNWTENPTGDTRIGFIAQEVSNVVPELTFTNPNSPEQYMGVHYDNVTALLVEAVKELSSGITTSNNTHLETQTILAEDNNIELNFNGTQQTAIGGGLTVLHAKGQGLSSDLITDANGNFVTNNDFKPQALTIPLYTPTSSNDAAGSEGNITRDDNYMYVKTSTGWKRTNLENF